MIRLAAFADEISPNLSEQIEVLLGEGIRYVELRSVWNKNVLDLTDEEADTIHTAYGDAGIRVSSIGSPIGKTPIDASLDECLQRCNRAVELAIKFGAPYIRLFSFYPPADGVIDPAEYRDEVISRLCIMGELTHDVRSTQTQEIILLIENDSDMFGESIAHSVDLMENVGPSFRAVLDPANFVLRGQAPYPDGYEALQPSIEYIHVKDAVHGGSVVPAGEGESHWPELLQRLRADGYDGFFSLEPHLASAEQYHGFSGPDLFRTASQALQRLLEAMDWEWE